jgi:carbonic anhydrase
MGSVVMNREMGTHADSAWPPHTARQVRLTCIDDRLTSAVFARQHGVAFEVRLAGGALALTDDRQEFALKELLVPAALGPLDTVFLEVHLACGAVSLAGHHFEQRDAERAFLAAVLDEAVRVVHRAAPSLTVHTRLVAPTGDALPVR